MGAQKHLRELLQFFIELPIFSGIPEGVFYHKYYTNLSKFNIVKGKKIINQGDKPEHITLLKTGLYGVSTQMSLYEITRLIFRYAKYFNNNDISYEKKNKYFLNNLGDIKNKYKILFQNVINIMNEENSLLNDNIIFKKFYNSQQIIRIADITCPEIIINEEYLDDNGLFAFSIESKSPENIIYTLSNSFYIDLKSKNLSVKKNQDRLLTEKMGLMVQRLLIIRNSMINSFFDSKSRNEVGASVIRELENIILKQLKKKRLLIKKEEKIIKENYNIENKGKKYLSNNNLNLNLKGYNNHFTKNKNKFFLEINSFLEDNTYYSKKNNKKKKLYLRLFQDFENNIKIQKNKIKNKKMKTLKFYGSKNIKFSNRLLNMHKKTLSSSPENTLNITNKEVNAINQLPFKDNEEDILFSLYDDNIDYNMSTSIYDNKLHNSNYNISRNQKNQFTQINKKVDKPFFNSFGYKSEEQKNNINFSLTREVLMNNLIWENIKSVIKNPINQKLNMINYNKTSSNYYKNKKIKNKNLQSFLENNSKCIKNRNINKNKISNCKTEENKYIKTYNTTVNNNNILTKHFSFSTIKFEKYNKVYILSSPSKLKNIFLSNIKTNEIKINNNTDYINKEIKKQNILNLKKVNKSIDSPSFKIRLKKFYSPHQINFMRMNQKMRQVMDINKYNIIKEEKFKNNRNDYYKKNIVNRMNHFYGATPD
jgi:iron complex outermembrane receptor protein